MPPLVSKQLPNGPTKATPIPAGSPWDMVDTVRMLLYGESGTGKTTLWATFPGPILCLICSGGSKPGELRSIDTPEYRKKITPVIIRCSADFTREINRAGDFATVVLDHASGFADMILAEVMGLDPTSPVTKYRVAGKGESWSAVDQRQYGQLAILGKEHFRTLLNVPGNVVVVAQQRTFGAKEDGGDPDLIRPTVGAALTPSLTGWLNPACDYVVQMFKRPLMVRTTRKVGKDEVETVSRGRGVEYCLRCEPHDIFMTKFRVPRGRDLPDVIVDPSYDKILKLIKGGK